MMMMNHAIARPFHHFGLPTQSTFFLSYWKWQVSTQLVGPPAPHILPYIAYIIMWRLSSSSDPAFLSLAVFDLIMFCVLFLIGCLKLGDVITKPNKSFRENLSNFNARYDYRLQRIWSQEDRECMEKTWACFFKGGC